MNGLLWARSKKKSSSKLLTTWYFYRPLFVIINNNNIYLCYTYLKNFGRQHLSIE